jgi:hypothetical protein
MDFEAGEIDMIDADDEDCELSEPEKTEIRVDGF